jgi:hypothetical protein
VRSLALVALLCACTAAPPRNPQPLGAAELRRPGKEAVAYVQALREEYRALSHIQALLDWYVSTQGETSLHAADYARAFVLAGMMHEGARRRFGEDWYGNPEVGRFLRAELFAPGTSLSAEDVAQRLGFALRLDFQAAARRAAQLVRDADALER